VRTHGYHCHDIDIVLNLALIVVAHVSFGAAMARVRGHYSRSPRQGRRSETRLFLIIGIVIAAIVIIWLITLN
jgi:hypothetical protein